jgi:alpha-ketoglutarate-dependent 2,4-dichlorophenoxyacetate dioxygenase
MALQITELHPMFGGDVTNLDLSKPLGQEQFDEIQAALDQYAVLVFHGPKLSEDDQIAFAERFGSLEGQNGVLSNKGPSRVNRKLVDISNLDANNGVLNAHDRRRMFALGNQLWHTDSSFKKTPAKYSLLHAHSVTPEGGETQFVDTRVAYEALPEKMKVKVDTLQAEHSIFVSRGKLGFTEFSDEERRMYPPVHRDLVRLHPGSGRRALYLASHASHIVGQYVPDGRMLIHELMEHATQPQFVYSHKWAPGDLVIWDNRCTMHRGRPYDEANHRRDMRRATVEDLDPAAQDKRAAAA